MSEDKDFGQKDAEVIELRRVPSSELKRIKIKIKERVSARKKKRKFPMLFKALIAIFLFAVIGFKVGQKIIQKYHSYWRKPYISFPADEEESQALQLKVDREASYTVHE